MSEPKRELVQSWLIKALHDLESARKVAAEPDPYFDVALYHCQQAAEKAGKGYLVYADTRFDKTHDIDSIVLLAIADEPTFAAWRGVARELTIYAFKYRYPGLTFDKPTRREFNKAYKNARAFYDFVLTLLPESTHPPLSE